MRKRFGYFQILRAMRLFLMMTFISGGILSLRFFGHSDFQSDQIDQLVRFATLIKIPSVRAFYGPYMSETVPVVYNLGPIFSALLAFLTNVGLDPDQIHFVCSILNYAGCCTLFFLIFKIFLIRGHGLLVLIWSGLVFSSHLFVQQAQQLWVNNFITLASLSTLYFYLRFEARPNLNNLVLLFCVFFTGLHLHATAIVGVILLVFAIFRHFLSVKNDSKKVNLQTWLFLIFAVVPYLLAELFTNFENTRAIFANIFHHSQNSLSEFQGFRAAKKSLYQFVEVLGLFPAENSPKVLRQIVAFGFGLIFVGLAREKYRCKRLSFSQEFLFLTLSTVCFMGLFFLSLNHRIGGPHYFYYGLIFFTYPWAYVLESSVNKIFRNNSAKVTWVISGGCALGVIFTEVRLDRLKSNRTYSYRDILNTLNLICETEKVLAVLEPSPDFETFPDPAYKTSALKYILKSAASGCHYDEKSMLLVALTGAGTEPAINISFASKAFVLHSRFDHGISLYKAIR